MHGENLIALRHQYRLTQVALAKLSGVAQSTISKIENNEVQSVGSEILSKIAGAFGMKLSDLLQVLEAKPAVPTLLPIAVDAMKTA